MKKLIAGIISLAAAFAAAGAISVCAGAETYEGFEYKALTGGGIEITAYTGDEVDIEIPQSINGKPVTNIGSYAFFQNKDIVSVYIPDTVKSLGDWTFQDCTNLSEVYISEGVTQIGSCVFAGCKNLKDVNIPSRLEDIGPASFRGCESLTSVILPDTLRKIESSTFAACKSLVYIAIPVKCGEIQWSAFENSTNLRDVYYSGSEDDWGHIAGIGRPSYYSNGSTIHYNYVIDPYMDVSPIKVTDRSTTSISLSWDSVDEADGYVVEKLVVDAWQPVEDIKDNSVTECKIDRLKAGTEYSLRVKAYRMEGDLGYYSIDNVINVTTKPTAVTGLSLKSGTSNSLSIAWDRNMNCDGYIVEMKDDGVWTRVSKIDQKSTVEFKKTGLKPSTSYSLRVCAYKMDGDTALYSDYATVTSYTNPSAVTGLKVKGRAADALRIAWAKNTSADGYIIEMKSGSTWTRVGKVTKNTTVEFKKSKLKAGTTYNFRVMAYNTVGKTTLYSTYTNISAITNPASITGLKLKARAADAVRLTWTKNANADGYIVEMKNGSSWTRVTKIAKYSTVEAKKSGLKAGTAYTFRVCAYKMDGKTALYSAYKTISVRTAPSAVSGLKLKSVAKDAVRLSWTKNTSADGYIVEMKVGNTWKRVTKISKNTTVEVKKSGLKSKTSYSFRIMTYKMSGKTALYGTAKTITVKTK